MSHSDSEIDCDDTVVVCKANLSSIVLVAMLLMQLVCCVRCTFVFVFPSCHRFFLGCWRRPGFLEDRGVRLSERLRASAAHTVVGVVQRSRDRNGSEDGVCDVQTHVSGVGSMGNGCWSRYCCHWIKTVRLKT
jgi:hypothetical protein